MAFAACFLRRSELTADPSRSYANALTKQATCQPRGPSNTAHAFRWFHVLALPLLTLVHAPIFILPRSCRLPAAAAPSPWSARGVGSPTTRHRRRRRFRLEQQPNGARVRSVGRARAASALPPTTSPTPRRRWCYSSTVGVPDALGRSLGGRPSRRSSGGPWWTGWGSAGGVARARAAAAATAEGA